MHQWQDSAIVISAQSYGEQSALVRLLTAEHGLFPGIVKGGFAKSARATYQPGNILHVTWRARLEEQLGQYRCELLTSSTAQLLRSQAALHVMNAICALVLSCVPERINENIIYNKIKEIINLFHVTCQPQRSEGSCATERDSSLAARNDNLLFQCYVEFELTLLQALGFGLDLTRCAATGSKAELIYVSPKSGRAVCREAGEPYKAKLLALPEFLMQCHLERSEGVHAASRDSLAPSQNNRQAILDGLALTGYFLEAWVLYAEHKKMPEARQRLIEFIVLPS